MPKSIHRYALDKVRQVLVSEVCYSNVFMSRIKVPNKSLSGELNNVFTQDLVHAYFCSPL